MQTSNLNGTCPLCGEDKLSYEIWFGDFHYKCLACGKELTKDQLKLTFKQQKETVRIKMKKVAEVPLNVCGKDIVVTKYEIE